MHQLFRSLQACALNRTLVLRQPCAASFTQVCHISKTRKQLSSSIASFSQQPSRLDDPQILQNPLGDAKLQKSAIPEVKPSQWRIVLWADESFRCMLSVIARTNAAIVGGDGGSHYIETGYRLRYPLCANIESHWIYHLSNRDRTPGIASEIRRVPEVCYLQEHVARPVFLWDSNDRGAAARWAVLLIDEPSTEEAESIASKMEEMILKYGDVAKAWANPHSMFENLDDFVVLLSQPPQDNLDLAVDLRGMSDVRSVEEESYDPSADCSTLKAGRPVPAADSTTGPSSWYAHRSGHLCDTWLTTSQQIGPPGPEVVEVAHLRWGSASFRGGGSFFHAFVELDATAGARSIAHRGAVAASPSPAVHAAFNFGIPFKHSDVSKAMIKHQVQHFIHFASLSEIQRRLKWRFEILVEFRTPP